MENFTIAPRANSSRKRRKEVTFATYWEEMNCLIEIYVTDDMIAGTHPKVMKLSQPLNKTLILYTELISAKALRNDQMYDE